ncbi:hypothetical protein [Thiolapillus sp.]|uniref:hypothetical protein n=1 Tax=Thiolapillus sp. TaxID=2017437 RepID=UPI002739BDC9|nr:hypothetical protein [Thiolapillus sp.]
MTECTQECYNFQACLRPASWSVPAAVVMGIPMYTNAAGIIPIVEALIGKGAPPWAPPWRS